MKFVFTFSRNFFKNDVIGVSAQTAFFLILSLPPLLVMLLSISSRYNIAILESSFVLYILPSNVNRILNSVIMSIRPSTQVTLISGLGVVFSASGSLWALMKGIHKTHNNGTAQLSYKYRLITACFTLVFLFVLLLSLGTHVMSGVWTGLMDTLTGFEKSGLGLLVNTFSAVTVYIFVFLLYHYTPEIELKGKEVFWGALFSAGAWMAASNFFEFYVTYFTKYTTVYGGIGAFFVLVLWLYVVSMIILTGAQINASVIEIFG